MKKLLFLFAVTFFLGVITTNGQKTKAKTKRYDPYDSSNFKKPHKIISPRDPASGLPTGKRSTTSKNMFGDSSLYPIKVKQKVKTKSK